MNISRRTFQSGKRGTSWWMSSLVIATLGGSIFINQAAAQGQPAVQRLPVWYEDTLVTQLRRVGDQPAPAIAARDELPQHVPQPFYVIVGGGVTQEHAVIGVIPGDIGYTGWWNVIITLNLSGRDHVANPFTNVAEIAALLCPIPGFPANIPDCFANGTPLFDLTGFAEEVPLLNVPIVQSGPPPGVCER